MKTLLRSASAGVLAAALVAGAAHAQDTAAPEPDEDDVTTVDAIIVTATKREQNLQDVPVVVTTVSQELLEDAGVRDIKDLQILTPGLTVTSTSNETITTARIRGIGTVGDNPGLESSVLVTIDGVYRPRNGVGFGDLGQVQRIEVLKGPQGTLFGKNASSGVINIITEAPSFDFEADGELTVGNYGQLGLAGSVSGPLISDRLAARLYAGRRVREGFLDVLTGPGPRTETEDVNQDFWTVRGQLLFTPSARTDVRIIADFSKRDEMCCLGPQLFVGQAANSRAAFINQIRPGAVDTTAMEFRRIARGNRDTDQRVEDKGISAEANIELGSGLNLTSITAARNFRSETGQDSDFTYADIVYRPDDGTNFTEFDQLSQELRIQGERGPLDFLVGAFYAREEVDAQFALLYGADYYAYFPRRVLSNVPALVGLVEGTIFQPGTGSRDSYSQTGTSWAVFTDNTFDISERLRLTLGLRWTVDEKELRARYTTTGSSCDQAEARFPTLAGLLGAATATTIVGGLCLNGENNDFDDLGPVTQSRREEALSGTLKLQYHLSNDIMTYASYSRGFKAGGFNLDREQAIVITPAGPNFTADPNTEFRGEYVDSYELGAKTNLLNRSLLLNATAFHQTFEDFQLNTFIGTAFIVETLPEVISRGADIDFIYITPVDGLSLQGGVTYAETQITEFTASQLLVPGRFNNLRRLPGSRLSFAPLWSASVAATFEHSIGNGLVLRSNLAAKYLSSYNTGSDLHFSKVQDPYTLVNGRIGIGTDDRRWSLEAWVQNLTDAEYLQVGFNGPFQVDENNDAISVYDAFLGQPRTYGMTLRVRY